MFLKLTIITAPVLVAALDVWVEAKVVGAVEAAKALHGSWGRLVLLTPGSTGRGLPRRGGLI